MKRKRFIQSLGLGVLSVNAMILDACRKSEPQLNKTINSNSSLQIEPEIIYSDSLIVDGYTDKLSYLPGESMKVFINGKIEEQVYIGLYTPSGIFKTYAKVFIKPQMPVQDAYREGFQYNVSFYFLIPDNLESGLYYWGKKIPFVVKNKNRNNSIVVLLPSNTDNAYNSKGGSSSYSSPMSPILSYQRPYNLARWHEAFWPWIEKLDYKMDYIIDQDLDDASNFSYAKVLILPGHSEYWTREARVNFDAFIDSGKDALVLSGNTMWWQVRYSVDKSQMICYKSVKDDPDSNPLLKTDLWTNTSLKYPIEKSIGMNFDLGGYGEGTPANMGGYKIVNEKSPLLTGTNLKNGDILSCLTLEYDGAFVKYEKGNPDPILDNKLNFHKIELVGYDFGMRSETKKSVGTFIVLQKTPKSGVMVNASSIDWCAKRGLEGKDGEKIKKITLNAINLLLNDSNVFSS